MTDLKTLKKIDVFLIILFVVITFIAILSAFNPNFGNYFSLKNFFETSELDKVPLWVAIGFTALVCFLGALIPFPIPYALPISLFSAVWIKAYGMPAWGLILLLVFIATIANTIGDLVDYFIGEGANYVMSKDDPEVQNKWARIILSRPKAIPGVIMVFALTPLPDVLLMVPLGMVKYDIKKTVFYMFIGRFIMLLIFALAGVFTIELVYAEGSGESGTEWILGVVLLYLMWLLIAVMAKLAPKAEKPAKQKTDPVAEIEE
jgi:membrane protein YqaA with SNARE-associated domain